MKGRARVRSIERVLSIQPLALRAGQLPIWYRPALMRNGELKPV
jgi:hypothetical protein